MEKLVIDPKIKPHIDEGEEWIAMVKEGVDTAIKELDPRRAYASLCYLERTMNEAMLYLRRKRIAHANKHGFKHL